MTVVRRPMGAVLVLLLLTSVLAVFQGTTSPPPAGAAPAPVMEMPDCPADSTRPWDPGDCGRVGTYGTLNVDGRLGEDDVAGLTVTANVPPCGDIPSGTVPSSPCYTGIGWYSVNQCAVYYLSSEQLSDSFICQQQMYAAGSPAPSTNQSLEFNGDLNDNFNSQFTNLCGGRGDYATYVAGGPKPHGTWAGKAARFLECQLTWRGPEPDGLRGPTWIRLEARLELAGVPGFPIGTSERMFVWVPIDGEMLNLGPQVRFEPTPAGGLSVDFDNTTFHYDDLPMTYEWNFGEGAGYTSTEHSPTHEYAAAGSYTVWLRATDSEGLTRYGREQVEVEIGELTGEWFRTDGLGAMVRQGETAPVRLRLDNGTGEDLSAVELVSAAVTGVADGEATLTRLAGELRGTLDAGGPGSVDFLDLELEGVAIGDVQLRAQVRAEDPAGGVVTGTIEATWEVRGSIVDVRWEAPDEVVAGSTFDATLVLDNQRGNPVDVTLHDPDHLAILDLVSAPASGERSIPVGETRYPYRFRAEHAIEAAFFDVSLDIHDPETGATDHPTRRHTLEVTPAELLARVITPDDPVVAGETVRVELEVENVTDEDVVGIAVPDGLELDPSAGSDATEVEAGATSLAPGETTRWSYDVTVADDAAGDIEVASSATGALASAPGEELRSNTATATLDVADALTIEVVAPSVTPTLGEPFSFDVVVRNNHPTDALEATYDEDGLFGFREDQYDVTQPAGALLEREVPLAPKSEETFTYTLSSELTPVALRAVATAPHDGDTLEAVDEASIELEAEVLDIDVESREDDDGLLEVTAFVTNRSEDVELTDVRFTTFSPVEWKDGIGEDEQGQLSRTTEDPASPPATLGPGEDFERTWRFRLIKDGTVRLAVGVEAEGDDEAEFAAASYTEVELGKVSAFARAQEGLVTAAEDATLRLRSALSENTGGISEAILAGIAEERPDSQLTEWEISTARSFGLPDDALAFLPDDRNEAIQHVARLASLKQSKTDEGRLNGAETVLGGLATSLQEAGSFWGDMVMSGEPGAFYRSALKEAGMDDGLVGEAYAWLEDNSREPWPPVAPWSLEAVRRDLGVADDVVLGAVEALAGAPRDALLASQDRAFAALDAGDPVLALAEMQGGVEEAKTIIGTEVALELVGEAGLAKSVAMFSDAAKNNDHLKFLDTPIGVGKKGGHTDHVAAVLERYAEVRHGDLAGLPNGPISLEDASRFVPEKDFQLLAEFAEDFKAKHGIELTWELVTINPLAVPKLQAGNLTPKTEMMGAHKAFTSADIAMGAPRQFGGELGGFDPSVSKLSQAEIARLDVEIPGFAERYKAQVKKWNNWSASEQLWAQGVRSVDDVPADVKGYWKDFYEPVRRAELGEITLEVGRPAGAVETQTYHLEVERGDGWFRILDRRNPMVDADGNPVLDASGNPVPRPYGSDLDLHAVLPEGGYPMGKRGQWESEIYAWSKNSGLSVGLHGWTNAGFDMAATPGMTLKRAEFAIERTDPSTWLDHADAYAKKINDHPQLGPAFKAKYGGDATGEFILKKAGLMDEAGELVLEKAQKVLKVTKNGIEVAHGSVTWLPPGVVIGPQMLAASPSAFLLGAPAAEPVATVTVDSLGDGVDATPGDGTCATSGGDCTLRAAVQEANATAGADVIALPAGTITLTVAGVDEDAAASGDLDVLDELTIVGATSGTTIDAAGLDRVLDVDRTSLRLVDLTLTGGAADGDGGAIFAGASELVLDGVTATGNVGSRGGAVATTFSTVTITGGTLADNVGSYGGALASSYDLDLDVTGTTLARNYAYQGEGGAVFLEGHDAPSAETVPGFSITDATFADNVARHLGGAIAVATLVGPFDDATFTVAGSTFSGNQAAGGGAIASDHGQLVVTGSTFSGNVAESGTGGAIRSLQPLTVTGSTFTGNHARNEGGAIAAFGSLDASDSTFTDNRSWDVGGAMWVFGGLTTRTLEFSGNQATGDPDTSFVAAPEMPSAGGGDDSDDGAAPPGGTQPLDPACPDGMPAPAFTDLGATHARAVGCAAHWALVEGYDATTFGTGETLTRGQMFTILTRLLAHLDVDLPTTVPDAFADDDGTTHEPAADLLAALGLAEGFADGSIGLATPVTRAQVATLLARIAGLAGDDLPAGPGRFADLDGSVHREAIERLAAAGILAGYDDTRYGPTDRLTRGQTATIVMRYLARLVDLGRATLPDL